MKKLNKYLILTKAILEINRNKISVDEIYNYLNHIQPKLFNIGYTFDKIDFLDITYFCEAFDFKYTKDRIIELNLDKVNLREELNVELESALKYDKKYILPIMERKNLLLYSINFSDNYLLDKVYKNSLLKYNLEKEHILDLSLIKNILEPEEIKKLFSNSSLELKYSYDLKTLDKIINTLEFITNNKYKLFHKNISNINLKEDNFLAEYKEIINLYNLALINTMDLKLILNKKEKNNVYKLNK